jgi:hypothetical protein
VIVPGGVYGGFILFLIGYWTRTLQVEEAGIRTRTEPQATVVLANAKTEKGRAGDRCRIPEPACF